MRQVSAFVLAAVTLAAPAFSKSKNPFLGRWDLTVATQNNTAPGWLEVTEEGGKLAARVQPRSGSVRPVENIAVEGGKLLVGVSKADETQKRPAVNWVLTVEGGKLTGTQKRGDTDAGAVSGVRAPELKRKAPKAWSAPEPLFNGKDLSGWEPTNPSRNNWVWQDGVMVNLKSGANIKTTRKFDDFKLHVELNSPEGANSGIYLRGRYEMQVEYEPAGVEDAFHKMGAIYGMVPVEVETPRKPGQWETFDITLVGRRVTVVRDGVTIIKDKEIAGITGGALDSNEAEPGPFYIQGDHTGGIKFRNVTVQVPKQ
jgi:hypothetical protein